MPNETPISFCFLSCGKHFLAVSISPYLHSLRSHRWQNPKKPERSSSSTPLSRPASVLKAGPRSFAWHKPRMLLIKMQRAKRLCGVWRTPLSLGGGRCPARSPALREFFPPAEVLQAPVVRALCHGRPTPAHRQLRAASIKHRLYFLFFIILTSV